MALLPLLLLLLQDPVALQEAHGPGVPDEPFNAMAFLSSKGKGNPIKGAQGARSRLVHVCLKSGIGTTGQRIVEV